MKRLFKSAILTLTAISFLSCMDLNPQANMGDDLVWGTAENFQLFANQFYGWSRDFSGVITDGPHSDYRGDMVCGSSVNVFSNGTNTIPSSDGNYGTNYKRIYYTNLLIKNAADFPNKEAISTPLGEAYFFRAYCHFDLVQLYGDAILVTEPLDLDSEKLTGKQDDRGVVVDQIISDLRQAATLLPDVAPSAGKLCKDAAYAFLSRVALYEGTWQKFHKGGADASANTPRSTELLGIAKQAASDVMTRGKFSLFHDPTLGDESYRYMFLLSEVVANPAKLLKEANTEYIFSRRHREGDKTANNLTHGMLNNALWTTRKMAQSYLCSDGLPIEKSPLFKGYTGYSSEFDNRDKRMSNNMLYQGVKYWDNEATTCRDSWDETDLTKARTADCRVNSGYANRKWACEHRVDDYFEAYDFPVIRYAEVLLNYAEACFELDGSISDADLDASLNLVRLRVNPTMPKLSNAFATANGLSLREEIRRERTVELFLEGFRLDDLKRWATAASEMPKDQLGVMYRGTSFESGWAAQARPLNSEGCILLYEGRTWAEKNYLLPLPSDQLQLNPGLVQNPGWTN